MDNFMTTDAPGTKGKKRKLLLICAVTAAFIIVAFAVAAVFFSNRWYPNSVVNGISISGKTLDDSMKAIQEFSNNYELKITGRDGGELVFHGKDIDLELDYEETLKELFDKEHEQSFLAYLFRTSNHEMEFAVSYSEEKLVSIIEESALMNGDGSYQIAAPEDAYVEYSEADQHYVIVPEVNGNTIKREALIKAASAAVVNLETVLSCEDDEADVYEEPAFKAADDTITGLCNQMNGYLMRWFEWDMGEGVTETLEPEKILPWLSINAEEHAVVLDEEALGIWLEELCLRYKTVGGPRQFTTHSGQTIELEGGDYGWRIDFDEEKKRLIEIFQGDINTEAVNSYIEDPSEANKEALLTKLEPEYSHTAYKKDYNNMFADWDTQNYSEVDLTAQMVYVYRNGQMVFSTKCVTGLPEGDRMTRTGVWFIKEKKEEKVLVGDDYQVDTKYWVRITWTGTGYHWSNRKDWGSWSPDLHKTKGSHGCVNLQLGDAKTLYGLVRVHDAVFIHY